MSLERVLHGERDKIIIEREANGRLAKLGGSRWSERAHNMTSLHAGVSIASSKSRVRVAVSSLNTFNIPWRHKS